ncbi:response regulator transcription factor [Aquibacillus albus]|uniref:Two-component system response regulator DegU n=1 Tax=Aquibacillus albus TaxID=1168171 RepID=A0ABS2N3J1_9BACI|nr:response regulator transcription factor [Aquibacillus albus]MBM7572709.1 two-component system response regulator DegU [Aquibacillus albus]
MKMTIIKEPNLLRDGIIKILQEYFLEHEVVAYGSKDYLTLQRETNDENGLVIIDCDTAINLFSTIDFYKNKNKKVIVWISNRDDVRLIDLFQLNLDGYFYNGMEKEELLAAVRGVRDGIQYIHPILSPVLLKDYARLHKTTPDKPVGVFSEREWEVIELLTQGFKNEQIAKLLFISVETVKNHVSQILKKLGVPDRTNIVLTAIRNNWVSI